MSAPSARFKAMAVVISLTVLGVAVLAAGATSLFGTKVGPLFNASQQALAANQLGGTTEAAPKKKANTLDAADAGAAATQEAAPSDGGARRPRLSPLGATKSGMVFKKEDFEPAPEAPVAQPAPQQAPAQATGAK